VETTAQEIRDEAAACRDRKVRQAGRMNSAELFYAGAELFDDACEITLQGIRADHSAWSFEECLGELRRLMKSVG
jgi:hypothetical protein